MMTPQELKNSILQMAIQGKLVEQRSEEGTAEELYQQIQAEKQALIKAGKIKKEKPYSTSTSYRDYPFDIPDTWKFVRFGELMISRDSERIPVSTSDRQHREKIYDYYGASVVIDKIDCFLFDKELLLIGEDGANLLARSTPIAFIARGKYWVNNHAHVLDACAGLDMQYVCYYINAISLAPYVTGTAQPKMNQENMNAIWVALPPLAEQKRIVAKIEELLPLIDRYEEAWTKLEEFNRRFPGDMQKSLLQMAIQGKLVEQRSEEGTAEELYRQIQAKKQALIKAGKIKKDKPLPEITEDEKPFEIPEGWKWVRWGEIVNIVSARRVHQADWKSEGIPFYRAREIAKLAENGYVDNDLFITQELYDEFSKSGVPQAGDLMVTAVGTLGKTYIVKPGDKFYYKDASVICFKNYAQILPKYLKYVMQSEMMKNQIKSNSDGTTVATLTMVRTVEYILPLPPLAEQKRIVAKLEELLPLCERLK